MKKSLKRREAGGYFNLEYGLTIGTTLMPANLKKFRAWLLLKCPEFPGIAAIFLDGHYSFLADSSPDWVTRISGLQTGLANQLVNYVLVDPSEEFTSVRLNNFMDGRNGVYRWNYPTQGQGKGYGPYELTGSFLLGWWGFLEDPRIGEVYRQLSDEFPLSEPVLGLYIGPGTTRDRHPLVKDPAPYTNGYFRLITRLAGGDPAFSGTP